MYEAKTKFGVVLFDDPEKPESGFISYGTINGKPSVKSINGINELPRDTLWWSNIETSTLSSGVEGSSWLRSEIFLGPKMTHVLNEWGIAMEKGGFKREVNQKIVNFLANRFNTVMKTATALVYETRKELGLPVNNELDWFRRNMLRGDFAALLPKPEMPEGEMISIVKKDQAYVDWTKTSAPYDASHVRLATNIPRGGYACRMLETKIPSGVFNYVSANDLSMKPKEIINTLLESDKPFIAEIVINKYASTQDESVFAFGNSMSKNNTRRSWITSAEFAGLNSIADLTVKSFFMAEGSQTLGDMLPEAMRKFVEDRSTTGRSWTAGVIAENIWRSMTIAPEQARKPSRRGVERPTSTIRAAWVKSSDKMNTIKVANYLLDLGDYSISGYGSGSVQVSCLSDSLRDLILDAAMPPENPDAASMPRMSDIPPHFAVEENIKWKGDREDAIYAIMSLYHQKKTIQALDSITLIDDKNERNTYVKKLVQDGLGAIKNDKAKFER